MATSDAVAEIAAAAADNNKKALQYIEHITSNADQVQQQVLSEILARSSHVEYLQQHGLEGRTDRETFKKVIPVITYEAIKSDINRIANGDTSPILCGHPISQFLTSSGTSGGEPKLMPMIEEEFERRSLFHGLQMPIMDQHVPDLNKGKAMQFMFAIPEVKTPGGLVYHTALSGYYKSPCFRNRSFDPYNDFTSPNEAILCPNDPDFYMSMYTQLLCGLYHHDHVLRVGAVFASTFLRVMRFLEKHWMLLSNDIRNGTVHSKITDSSVREAVLRIQKPDAQLADFIETECSKPSWEGIITRLWPNAKYVEVIITGSMSQYIPTLDYYSNKLPIVSALYASSESYFGLNLEPLSKPTDVSYTLIPTMAYFEFIPTEKTDSEFENLISTVHTSNEKKIRELVDLADVKLGEEYELVVTTYTGLYRYIVGDMLRVSGFKNNAPQFNFMCRRNVVLSIDTDKTDEVELRNATQKAINHLAPFGACLVDYTSLADASTFPGHYVLYWELRHEGESSSIPSSVFEECCLTVEQSFSKEYIEIRAVDNLVGPLEIRIVEPETFDKVMDYAIGRGVSISQYKTPRCVKSAPVIELLNSKVISSYSSQKSPQLSSREWEQ